MRELYDHAELPYSPEFDAAMRRWSDENPSNRYGRFTYSADALGADVRALDRRLDPYRERFGVAPEVPVMAFGDNPNDASMLAAWHVFCDQVRGSG